MEVKLDAKPQETLEATRDVIMEEKLGVIQEAKKEVIFDALA